MKLTRNIKAISKILLILLLLGAAIIGGILSYLWVMGYVITLGIRIPEKSALAITNTTFNSQNTSYFDVTILNPSYSPEATITQIAASTEDGVIHNVTETDPPLPYRLPKAEEKTFRCTWDWANHTGETVRITASVADGSGSTFEVETPLVILEIVAPLFDSTINVAHFNMTVQNRAESETYVNVTGITVDAEEVALLVPPVFPSLHPDDSVPFMCSWDWTDYQGKNVTITVKTLQGYMARACTTLPSPVVLTITDVLFEVTNTTRFNVTVQYSEGFPQYVNITRITATLENGTPEDITKSVPPLPYALNKSSSETFLCPWNWTEHRNEKVTVTAYTLQGFVAPPYTKVTPAPIILEISNITFNPLNTTIFNFTVKNTEYSLSDANITEILVTTENEIVANVTDKVVPSLPQVLNRTQLIPFNCTWDWADYSGENVTIVVQTEEGYSASSDPVPLKALTITDAVFNSLDTNHFLVTIQNPTELDFNITTINAEIKDGPALNITDVEPDLSFILPPGTNLTFMCSCGWAGYQGEVTITIETSKGYTTSRTFKIPSV